MIVMGLMAASLIAGLLLGGRAYSQPAEPPPAAPSRLAVLWTSADDHVAHRMCLMYSHAAKRAKWFDEVTLIVWGPSQRLLVADKDLQKKIKAMMADGVKVHACIACADSYGLTARLRELGLVVRGMGKPLSDMLKDGWKVITF
jgi:hypothetical protein